MKQKIVSPGHGFGKVILFGEHFVVYSLPAIVCATTHRIEASVEPAEEYSLIDGTIRFPGVPPLTWKLCQKPILRVCRHLNISTPLKIVFGGTLPVPHSGIGSSAACFVALVRAINNRFSMNLSEQEICNAAFEGEKEVHGNPSGIDNTAATYGGLFWFEKGAISHKPLFSHPIPVVLAESGRPTETKTVIESVKKFVEKNKTKANSIFNAYKELVHQAKRALEEGKLETVGQLMDENHHLLRELTVSCEELEKVVFIARQTGALGAKLTGTGRGGLAVALTPSKELQNSVTTALNAAGYTTLTTTLK